MPASCRARRCSPTCFRARASEILRRRASIAIRARYIRYSALPSIAPFLWRYFLASSPRGRQTRRRRCAALIERCLAEHARSPRPRARARCCARAAGSRSSAPRAAPMRGSPTPRRSRPYGVAFDALTRDQLLALEPHLGEAAKGGVHFTDPLTTPDPQALAKSYADLFSRAAGALVKGDARSLAASGGGWTVATRRRRAQRARVVVALGPWSGEFARDARLSPAVRRQARLSHALRAARQRRAQRARCSISRRAMSSRRWRAACA